MTTFELDRVQEADIATSMTRRPISRSITLLELSAAADLQTRVDRKYLLPADLAWDVIAEAAPGARMLEIDGQREFPYRSTYFDTTELTSFRGAAGRRRRRFKVRTRSYGEKECYLEVKTRDGRGRSVKHRIPHPLHAARHLCDADLAVVRRTLQRDGIDLGRGEAATLLPVADTSYTRSTIYLPGSGARLTIDQGLRWRDQAGRELCLYDLVILETKSSRDASEVDRALWWRGCRPRSLSKYATGMVLLFPDLPGNRWHRTLDLLGRHLREPGGARQAGESDDC